MTATVIINIYVKRSKIVSWKKKKNTGRRVNAALPASPREYSSTHNSYVGLARGAKIAVPTVRQNGRYGENDRMRARTGLKVTDVNSYTVGRTWPSAGSCRLCLRPSCPCRRRDVAWFVVARANQQATGLRVSRPAFVLAAWRYVLTAIDRKKILMKTTITSGDERRPYDGSTTRPTRANGFRFEIRVVAIARSRVGRVGFRLNTVSHCLCPSCGREHIVVRPSGVPATVSRVSRPTFVLAAWRYALTVVD